jgi:hypothetical protein
MNSLIDTAAAVNCGGAAEVGGWVLEAGRKWRLEVGLWRLVSGKLVASGMS